MWDASPVYYSGVFRLRNPQYLTCVLFHMVKIYSSDGFMFNSVSTSSSAAAERPREPLSQLKSCQLLHNCTKKSHLTRWIALSCGIKNIACRFFGLATKHACDGQTDRQTDGRADRITTSKTALEHSSRGKNVRRLGSARDVHNVIDALTQSR